jgi:hypothetical protein
LYQVRIDHPAGVLIEDAFFEQGVRHSHQNAAALKRCCMIRSLVD